MKAIRTASTFKRRPGFARSVLKSGVMPPHFRTRALRRAAWGGLFIVFVLSLAASLATAEPTIERVEYFFGEDPGYGQATEWSVPDGQSTVDLSLELPAEFLPDGPLPRLTVRSLNSEGTWSPPARLLLTRTHFPGDTEPALTAVSGFVTTSEGTVEPVSIPVPEGEPAAESAIAFTAPADGIVRGWAQAESSAGITGPRQPFRVKMFDRFAGRGMGELDTVHFAVLDGDSVVTAGTAATATPIATADTVSGIDLSALEAGRDYTLILTPVSSQGHFPGFKIGTEILAVTDYQYWRRAHFAEAEAGDDAISGPGADPGDSGVTNLERFIAGVGPGVPFPGLRAGIELVADKGMVRSELTFDRASLAAGLELLVEESPDLIAWDEVIIEQIDVAPAGEGRQRITIQPESNVGKEPQIFYRIRILDLDL